MKTQTLGLLAILSLGIGLTGFSSASVFEESTGIGSYEESSAVSGHVTVVHKDAQENILGYQQYDNIIVNEGLACITELTFGTTNSTTCTAASGTDKFTKIGLLGSTPTPVATSNTSNLPTVTGGGLDIVTATTIDVDAEPVGTGSTQGNSVTALQHTFTKTNATAATIGGAVVENGAGDALFAAKAFTGGDVVLNENDTLEVTWSITIG